MRAMDYINTIGNTPIVKLSNIEEAREGRELFAKLELFNPGRSVKDRIAKNILENAERENLIDEDTVIIESSSGNTAIGLSILCRIKKLKNIVVLDQNCPKEKEKMIRALGAQVIKVVSDGDTAMDLTEKRIEIIKELKQNLKKVFIPNQYENKHAPLAHYTYTAQEIIDFMEEHKIFFSMVLISVGTGGTISGISKRLKEYDKKIEIYGIEPDGSTLFGGSRGPYLQQGPGNYFVPANLCYEYIDEGIKVNDQDAFSMCRKAVRDEGILLGGSSGALLHAAVEIFKERTGNILCILPDGGEKYLDTIYSDDWLKSNGIRIEEKTSTTPVIEVNIDKNIRYDEIIKKIY